MNYHLFEDHRRAKTQSLRSAALSFIRSDYYLRSARYFFASNGRNAWHTRHGPSGFVLMVSATVRSILGILSGFPTVVIDSGVVNQNIEMIVRVRYRSRGSFDAARVGHVQTALRLPQ